jgi:hypothetical protein
LEINALAQFECVLRWRYLRVTFCKPWDDLGAAVAVVPEQFLVLIVQYFIVKLVV